MDRSSLAPWREARETSDDTWRDDAAGNEFRGRLLTAAEEDASAIVEDTRQQILLTVRRARRDLLRVQTQLHVYDRNSRHPHAESPEPLVVRHTTALRQIARDAATELDLLSTLGAAVAARQVTMSEVIVNAVTDTAPEESEATAMAWVARFPSVSAPQLVVAAVVALVAVTGAIGFTYANRSTRSAPASPPPAPIVPPPVRDQPAQAATVTPSQTAAVRGTAPPRAELESRRALPGDTRTPPPPAPDSGRAPAMRAAEGAATPERPAGSSAASPAGDGDPQATIFAKHVQWFDAFGRGDQQAMADVTTAGFSLRDERSTRSANADASGSTPAQVTDVHIDVAGPGAVLTARLHSTVDGRATESLLSEVWVRGEQQWALMGVRITPVDRVPQPGNR